MSKSRGDEHDFAAVTTVPTTGSSATPRTPTATRCRSTRSIKETAGTLQRDQPRPLAQTYRVGREDRRWLDAEARDSEVLRRRRNLGAGSPCTGARCDRRGSRSREPLGVAARGESERAHARRGRRARRERSGARRDDGGDTAVRLAAQPDSLLHALTEVGRCMALTRNDSVVSGVRGRYGGIELGKHAGRVFGEHIDPASRSTSGAASLRSTSRIRRERASAAPQHPGVRFERARRSTRSISSPTEITSPGMLSSSRAPSPHRSSSSPIPAARTRRSLARSSPRSSRPRGTR